MASGSFSRHQLCRSGNVAATLLLLPWWFSRGLPPPLPRGHCAMPGDIWDGHSWGRCTRQVQRGSPTTRNRLAHTVALSLWGLPRRELPVPAPGCMGLRYFLRLPGHCTLTATAPEGSFSLQPCPSSALSKMRFKTPNSFKKNQ